MVHTLALPWASAEAAARHGPPGLYQEPRGAVLSCPAWFMFWRREVPAEVQSCGKILWGRGGDHWQCGTSPFLPLGTNMPHGLELRRSGMAGERGHCSPGCCFSHWHQAQALGHHTLPQQPGLDPRGPSLWPEDLCSRPQPLCVPGQAFPFVLMPASSSSLNDPSPSPVFILRVYL